MKKRSRETGEIEGVSYEEITYEGYGHGGVAILVEVTTDNKNRTVAELRHCFSKYGGSLAESGAVAYNFDRKGLIEINSTDLDEEELILQVLDLCADDVDKDDDSFNIFTLPSDLYKVVTNFENTNYKIIKAKFTRIPENTINAGDNFGKNQDGGKLNEQ